jgi:hypothetical protein
MKCMAKIKQMSEPDTMSEAENGTHCLHILDYFFHIMMLSI